METIKVYASLSQYDCSALRGVKLDHVWVCSEKSLHNWNCYGRGMEGNGFPGSRQIGIASGNADWMAAVYGVEAEGKGGRANGGLPAAGVVELLGGVCQNAANRILAMTAENIDVSKANANEIVVLSFGKYGAGVNAFVDQLKKTAEVLNMRRPGSVSDQDLARVLANVEKGCAATSEIDALIDDLPAHVREGLIEGSTEVERHAFVVEYAEYQKRREAKFDEIMKMNLPNHDARGVMGEFLKCELTALFERLRACMGKDRYLAILRVLPGEVFDALSYIK